MNEDQYLADNAVDILAAEVVRLRARLVEDPDDFEADCKLLIAEDDMRKACAARLEAAQ